MLDLGGKKNESISSSTELLMDVTTSRGQLHVDRDPGLHNKNIDDEDKHNMCLLGFIKLNIANKWPKREKISKLNMVFQF